MSMHFGIGMSKGHLNRLAAGVASFPSRGAVADMDFKNNRYSGPAVSNSNASGGYIDDSQGNWTFVPANTLRRSDKGLLVEGAQTNSIRNNSMQGAVAGTPGTAPTNWSFGVVSGISTQIVGTGTEGGIDYIDVRFFGTSTASGNVVSFTPETGAITIASGQLWTFSAFVRLISGTLPGTLQFYWADNGNAGSVAVPIPNGNSLASQRAVLNHSTGASSTSYSGNNYYIQAASGTVVNVTLRIGWPQLEQWNTSVTTVGGASSPIRTTGTAATRNADVVSATTTLPAYAGTIVFISNDLIGTSFPQYVTISEGANANRVFIQRSASPEFYGLSSVSGTNTGGPRQSRPDGRNALAFAFQNNDYSLSVNGSTPLTTSTFPVPSSTPTKLNVGSGPTNTGQPNAYIERLAIYPTRRSNSDLQQLSQLSNWGG